jgi:galactosylceramidase
MKYDGSQCAWSNSVNYNTTNQTATFQLDSSFGHITHFFVFFSDFNTYDVDQTFIYKGVIPLNNGKFTLELPVGVVYTVSTINGTKGIYKTSPPSTPFPLPYADDFERYATSSEAAFFSDQSGSWEIVDTFSNRGKVMKQMITKVPISWCKEAPYPYSMLGDSNWQQPLKVSVDVMIESIGTAFVAIGVSKGSCVAGDIGSPAVVFSISTTNSGIWKLTASTNLTNPLSYGMIPVIAGTWYTLTLIVLADHSKAYINGKLVGRCSLNASSSKGLVAIGSSWDFVQFDSFHIQSPKQARKHSLLSIIIIELP